VPPPYRHAEAYHLMTYQADDGTEAEQVWNSRDGVTPFVITLRSGKQATHVAWNADVRMPEDFTPPPGMRYFTDLTPARARRHAERAVDRWEADPRHAPGYRQAFGGGRESAITSLAASYLEQPGTPDLIDPAEATA
jgi:hypothetical protein